jgi:regulator of RNase E activity RraA
MGLAYAYDVNLLGDNIDTIKKNTETLIDASKVVGLEINTEKIKNMMLSHHWNAGQIIGKCVTVQIFGNDSNKSKFDLGGN